eukprot:CAMPEP_0182868296 /NCGR_PEP_ID=MMETSP0034_2-20130328/9225_1 /TAXON_ID=156128 /ORGANISM="Nephroselmis pyriformis, Strain CCMP717" /LENGTH=403 /DNA_ID=CAMNT_0025000691 /DNA_START=119 /DNA_END=1330 /DNA_ORIENTATION=+
MPAISACPARGGARGIPALRAPARLSRRAIVACGAAQGSSWGARRQIGGAGVVPGASLIGAPALPPREVRPRTVRVEAFEGGAAEGEEEPKKPSGFVAGLVRPLLDFGFGKKSMWEGGVGLFVISGVGMAVLLIGWMKGLSIAARSKGYQAVVEFPLACGISVGTPVRIRGVGVGGVLSVRPSLERVDVLVEVKDSNVVIPRNALIEANQSGLIAETLVDITPRLPIPPYTAGPLDEGCEQEGMIVCDRGRITGQTGVSLDDLVSIATKLARQMDEQGLDKMFTAAEVASQAIEDAKPLLDQVLELTREITPMLAELREGEMLSSVESLTATLAAAADDIRRLNNAVLTDENTQLLRESVATLTDTLKHVEAISNDVSSMTGDSATKQNLRHLIQSLSRLVSD